MPEEPSTFELDDRIAIVRGNLRLLTEQATVSSGSADEDRTADRIAQQSAELEDLLKRREALTWH